jgi:hypothetical protein
VCSSDLSTNNNLLQIPSQSVPAKPSGDMPPPAPGVPGIEVPKLELDTAKKEKTMAEFLLMMDNYAPIVKFNGYFLCNFLLTRFFFLGTDTRCSN